MEHIIPDFLKPGSRVALAATARWVTPEQMSAAEKLISAQEWIPVPGENIFERKNQLAGDEERRAQIFQQFLDDPSLDAIVCVRGGYGTVQMIDRLDFSRWQRRPSWICGYSDATVLLSHLDGLGVCGIHSSMPVSFDDCTEQANRAFVDCLKGEQKEIRWSSGFSESSEMEGQVKGGNLSVLYSILGSVSMPDFSGSVVFLEDVDEMVYHIDRMMEGLFRAGAFRDIRGFLVGGMTQMRDNTIAYGFKTDNPFGTDAISIIRRMGVRLGVPVITGFPAGHQADNRAFYLGRRARIVSERGTSVLTWG